VQNGDGQTPEYWRELREWMGVRANVAAFAAALRETDMAGFEPMTPPTFEGKRRMVEEAKSDLDEAFEIALRNLPGKAMTVPQVVKAMRTAFDVYDLTPFRGELEPVVRRMARTSLFNIGERDGPSDRLKEDGRKYRMFARTRKDAAALAEAGAESVRREALKN